MKRILIAVAAVVVLIVCGFLAVTSYYVLRAFNEDAPAPQVAQPTLMPAAEVPTVAATPTFEEVLQSSINREGGRGTVQGVEFYPGGVEVQWQLGGG